MINIVQKVLKITVSLCSISFLLAANFTVTAAEPTYKQGETIFIETGVETPDRNPTFYASTAAKPYAPVFEMLATKKVRRVAIIRIPIP